MGKRNQINISLEDAEIDLVNEYCRVHDRTPQWLFKAGARRMIDEDMQERKADLMTLQSWREIKDGLSEPIDDLLEMNAGDRKLGDEISSERHQKDKRSA